MNGPSAKTAVIRRADPPDGRRRQGSAEMACSTEMRQQTQPDSGSSAVDRSTHDSAVGALVFALPCRVSAILTRLGSVGYPRSRPLGREVPSKSEEACKPTKSRAFRVASADGTHALPMARRRAHSLRPSTDPACSGCSAPPPGDRCDSVFSFSGGGFPDTASLFRFRGRPRPSKLL